MSIPTSLEAIVIIVLLFIPGYLAVQIMKMMIANISVTPDMRYLFALIVWGGIVHGISFAVGFTGPVIDWYVNHELLDHRGWVVAWGVCTLLLLPIALAIVISRLTLPERIDAVLGAFNMSYTDRIPSAWFHALKLGPAWVRIHLKDGTMIGGRYQSRSVGDSFDENDIYIEELYNLNEYGDFEDKIPGNAGLWIRQEMINYVVFFHTEEETTTDTQSN